MMFRVSLLDWVGSDAAGVLPEALADGDGEPETDAGAGEAAAGEAAGAGVLTLADVLGGAEVLVGGAVPLQASSSAESRTRDAVFQ